MLMPNKEFSTSRANDSEPEQTTVLKVLDGKAKPIVESFKKFEAISLEETNRSASMLKRFDNKYVVNRSQFEEFLSLALDDFFILEIEGSRQFSYSSCYYDDEVYQCYLDHLQGKRHRFKVRTREYVDSGLMFFEVKLKGLRGQTDKHRIATDSFSPTSIQESELNLLTQVYEQSYGHQYDYNLKPTLIVDYIRCTLVAKSGGERVTIDFSLAFTPFKKEKEKIQISENFIIIETKSADGKGLADNTIKNLGVRKASKCSKYCLGVNLSGDVDQSNSFLPMIRRISENIISGKQIFKTDEQLLAELENK